MKRLVILCDGTWNSPDKTENGVPVATNVVKLADAIPRNHEGVEQRVFYDAGIGSAGLAVYRLFAGATGTGISRNILQAYRFVIDSYVIGDELYLFGFSRGAFTVRSLAGLINKCGILSRDARGVIPQAYDLYCSRRPEAHPREHEATLFRRTYSVEDVTRIAFIGVWDTVGALGNPLRLRTISPWNRFHDTNLSRYVRHAYHALAIDETRQNFSPTLWNQQSTEFGQIMEQRWFVGVHSNVGGGYPDVGLSDIALAWLAGKAGEVGLGIGDLQLAANPKGRLVDSRTGFYKAIPKSYRPIDKPGTDKKTGNTMVTNETLDESVLVRYRADSKYRPRNLVNYLHRHPDLLV